MKELIERLKKLKTDMFDYDKYYGCESELEDIIEKLELYLLPKKLPSAEKRVIRFDVDLFKNSVIRPGFDIDYVKDKLIEAGFNLDNEVEHFIDPATNEVVFQQKVTENVL